MNTVLQIIRESGGFHSGKSISIEPWMRRAVEVLPELARTGDSNIYVVVVLVRVSDSCVTRRSS